MTSQTNNQSPVVEVQGISKQFPTDHNARVHAVTDVSLHIDHGETLAVVGESGCGKSTLANLIIRLHDADQGRILLKGVDITDLNPREMRAHRQTLQVIFQDPFASLDPRVRVGASVAEPLMVHKVATKEEAIRSFHEAVGLYNHHRPHLSLNYDVPARVHDHAA